MSAHVLLNLLNELGKRDKMWGLQSIFIFLGNEFNKFNNTRAGKLDSIDQMTLRILWNLIVVVKAPVGRVLWEELLILSRFHS